VRERLVAVRPGGVVDLRPHLVGQLLTRRGQPLLVPAGQDDPGLRGRGERAEDGQADLAGAAEKEDPGRGTRPVRENFHSSHRSANRPATNRASQHASQASIGPSLVSRSSTGADVRRPVRTANLTSAATSGSALARCQGLAPACSEAAQATYAAIMPAPTAS